MTVEEKEKLMTRLAEIMNSFKGKVLTRFTEEEYLTIFEKFDNNKLTPIERFNVMDMFKQMMDVMDYDKYTISELTGEAILGGLIYTHNYTREEADRQKLEKTN